MRTKVFLDTNVLLDILIPGRVYEKESRIIMDVVMKGGLEAVLTVQSVLDAAYVASRSAGYNPDAFRQSIQTIRNCVNLDSLDNFDLAHALDSVHKDLEDLCQASRAFNTACDYIITGDCRFRCPEWMQTPVVTPLDFVNKMRG